VIESLVTMGVVTVGECWRLPRDGFARRFGPRLRLELDRAAGRLPEPRATHVAPARYHARHELEPELADAGRLLNAAVPLLEELCGFLRERGAGVESLELRLVHRESPDTRLRLRFAGPVDRAPRIATLLGERLAQVALPEPVRRLQLRSGPLVRVAEEAGDLFARGRPQSAAVPQLVERLRARLGPSAVHGLRLVPGHRPEAVQENGDIPLFSPPAIAGAGRYAETRECSPFRPTWLLAEPQALGQGTPPCCEGPLEIEAGPERIESGWWDGRDVRRDYYVARNPAGVRLWIFRGRGADEGWYLHGVFG
jgi:protein ImuB